MELVKTSCTDEFGELIERELNNLEVAVNPRELSDPIKYTLALGGKRMRPVLLMLANEMFGGNRKEALSPALAIEVFHNFTLVHDDIMDNAPIRRNQPSVYKKWNSNIAILSGDVMMVLAYRLLEKIKPENLSKIYSIFNETAIKVCEGQQYDLNYEKQHEVTIDQYIHMISLKTAWLLAGCMKIGAVIGGATPSQAQTMHEFGMNLGISFQLMDDYLDAFGEEGKFGKKIGGDIEANKKTYLLIKTLELAKGGNKDELQKLLDSKDNPAKIDAVIQMYNTLGVRELTAKAINHYHLKAVENMAQIGVNNNATREILAFVERLRVREV